MKNVSYWLNQILILTKARVILLMMSTSYVGMVLVPGPTHSSLEYIKVLIGLSAIAASGAVANQIFDRDIDKNMIRTKHRPLVKEVFSITQAIQIGIFLWLMGSTILLTCSNTLTWLLTSLGAIGYGLIYTCFLKKASPQNIVLGGLSGALPPLLGWVAMANETSSTAWLLVALIFVWTPAHFWALAIHRQADYTHAKIPMLSVTHGNSFTAFAIVLYTLLLFPICLLLWATHIPSFLFLMASMTLTTGYLILNILLLYSPKYFARLSFRYSIVYLYLLFFTMILERLIFL